MMTSGKEINSRSIVEWCDGFRVLYEKPDDKRKPEDIWIATMAHCSSIGEEIRKSAYLDLVKCAAHAFCWMCSYIVKCNNTNEHIFKWKNTFCEVVYFKYPIACGHCLKKPCVCSPPKMEATKDKGANIPKLYECWKGVGTEGFDLNKWINTFKDIYEARINLQSFESIGFHFLEEAGEEAKAIRKLTQLRGVLDAGIEGVDHNFLDNISSIDGLKKEYDSTKTGKDGKPIFNLTSIEPKDIRARIVDAKMDFVIEFADTFSWFCAILIKLEVILDKLGIKKEKYNIENKLQNEYGKIGDPLICPECKTEVCECVLF